MKIKRSELEKLLKFINRKNQRELIDILTGEACPTGTDDDVCPNDNNDTGFPCRGWDVGKNILMKTLRMIKHG
jgi:hypothetical protein